MAAAAVVVGALAAAPAAPAQSEECTITWTGLGADGSWETAANWFPVGVPGPDDDVCVPADALSDPVLPSNPDHSAGETRVRGLRLERPLRVDAGMLTVTRSALILGAGTITLDSDATFRNEGGLELREGTDLLGAGVVENAAGATIVKSAGGGASAIAPRLANAGTLRLDGDALSLQGGTPAGAPHGGAFQLAPGTTLELAGAGATHEFGAQSSVSGAGATLRVVPGPVVTGLGSFALGAIAVSGGESSLDGPTAAQSLAVSGGRLRLGRSASPNTVAVSGGELLLDGAEAFALPALSLTGGSVSGSAPLTVTGIFDWSGGAHGGSGETTIAPGGTLVLDGGARALARTLASAQTVWASGDLALAADGELVNVGALTIAGTPTAGGSGRIANAPDATLRKVGDGAATVGSAFRNDGLVAVESGILALDGAFENLDPSTGELEGGTYELRGVLRLARSVTSNAARLVLDGAAAGLRGPADGDALGSLSENALTGELELLAGAAVATQEPVLNSGAVTIGEGSFFATPGRYEQADGHTTLAHPTAELRAQPVKLTGGSLDGSGRVVGGLEHTAGTISPGASPGELRVSGDYVQGAGATLQIEIAGVRPGIDYDRVLVGGGARLGGALEIVLLEGYAPGDNDRFEVVRSEGPREGAFADVRGTDIDDERIFSPTYGPNDATLAVVARNAPQPSTPVVDTAPREEERPAAPAEREEPPPAPLADPRLGASVNLEPAGGTVRVRRPGESRFGPVDTGMQVPLGSLVDTVDGVVKLTSATTREGALQSGRFSQGVFRVTQPQAVASAVQKGGAVTELELVGGFRQPAEGRYARCHRPLGRELGYGARRGRVRRLFGSAQGRFRTRGRYSSATVRGTEWTVEDRCGLTFTTVQKGRVLVEDAYLGRRVLLGKGQRYVAGPRPERLARKRGLSPLGNSRRQVRNAG